MEKYTVEQVLNAVANLADMLVHASLSQQDIIDFQEYLKQGLTLEEAQDKIVAHYSF